jgi:hypothetical protein
VGRSPNRLEARQLPAVHEAGSWLDLEVDVKGVDRIWDYDNVEAVVEGLR